MTKEDLLWVALKISGVYYTAKGLMAALNFVAASVQRGGVGPPVGMGLISAGVPLAIGIYLLVDGSAIVRLASRGSTRVQDDK